MATAQAPIASPFDAASTAADVLRGIDLSGRLAVVTGGSSGIGVETVRALRAAGAEVIAPTRAQLDLMSPASVDAFAAPLVASGRPLHLLVNNAGHIAPVLVRDARGYESQFATNHLGHVRLTRRLWPALVRGAARVIALSSVGHRRAPVDFDDWSFERRPYDAMLAYGQSKTANALFAVALDRRGAAAGVRAFSVHPGGIIRTGLVRFMSEAEKQASGYLDPDGTPRIDPAANMKTPEMGAATTLWAATSPLLAGMGGVYCCDCNIAEAVGPDDTGHRGVRPWACDPDAAERLWALSEQLEAL